MIGRVEIDQPGQYRPARVPVSELDCNLSRGRAVRPKVVG